MSKKKRTKTRPLAQPAQAASTALPAGPAQPAGPEPRRAGWWLNAAEGLSLAGIFIFMLMQSWLRWMDPLIDFPKDLYLAWRVSEGDLLYKDVTTWYGPLPQLTEGAGFHFFGAGIDTIVWMNIILTIGVLLLVWGIFATLGNRLSRWLCLAVFIGVFVFGQYTTTANYNFITPYVAQSTYGFAGLVLLLWALLRQVKTAQPRWLVLAGVGLAIAYLDKPEPLLASLGALAVYGVAEFLRQARKNPESTDWPAALRWTRQYIWRVAGGFLSLWLPVFLYFLVRGGFAYAWLATNYVPHSVLDSRFQAAVEHSHLSLAFFGWDDPWRHFFSHVRAGVGLVVVLGLMLGAAYWRERAGPNHFARWLGPVVMFAAAVLGAWLGGDNYWMDVGEAFVFPVVLAAVVVAGWSWWAAWRGQPTAAHLQCLAVVGTAAGLMLARMILHGRIYQFGFFMMPLAVLFVIHVVVGERGWSPPGSSRGRWLLPVVFTALVLWGVTTLAGVSFRIYARKTDLVGTGRDQFYTVAQRNAQNIKVLNPASGVLLDLMIQTFRTKTPNAKTLAVFPEGIAVNYHLRVPSPLAELEFHPLALAYFGADHVVDELNARPPDAIFLHIRSYKEFNEKYFGDNDASGRPIMAWIAANYERLAKGGHTPDTVTGNALDLLTPKIRPGAQPLFIAEPIN